ncbi:MAG: hypothetical protein LAO31_19395 [Acidobacteriia bacterium]|nr:hypothetical protein [Terriglobia bacterium]
MSTPRALPQDPVPLRRVNIYVTRDVAFNIKKMNQITDSVLKRLGCDGCHSGRVLDYHIIEDFVVNPQSLEITELPGGGRF